MTNRHGERGYDSLAMVYQAIERAVFGDQLQTARVALLSELPDWKRLLIFGDGDGRLIEAILQSRSVYESDSQPRTIWSVDQSSKMLDRQRRRVLELRTNVSVRFVHGNALMIGREAMPGREAMVGPQASSWDIIVTPFFLDCFTPDELKQAMPVWAAALRDHGVWYHVDFVMPDRGWQRVRAGVLLTAMHSFFRYTTGLRNRRLVNLEPLFASIDFQPIRRATSGHGMIESTLYRRRVGPSSSMSVR